MAQAKAVNPLIRRYGPKPEVVETELEKSWSEPSEEQMIPSSTKFKEESLVKGRVVTIEKDVVVVDIGGKSPGVISKHEFEHEETPVKVNDELTVLIEEINEDGLTQLSKRKADRQISWEKFDAHYNEGDIVRGKVARKIKGGLLIIIPVDEVTVSAFLPASQVSIRRTKDAGEFIGEELECEIIKKDKARQNIVCSARKLQERNREKLKDALLEEIEEGQEREGLVKNIADFGAFVDLGGIDGLLHITDMTWGRIQHPSEVLKINDQIKVKVLKVDKDRERIALGMKQLSDSPWKGIAERYPVESEHTGKVVNIMNYGAFIRLEEGIEGLVHVSEMSWTKRVNDPREVVQLGDDVKVQILGVNEEKQEISLGMKQLEENPWERVAQQYQVNTEVEGTIRNLTTYGAFVEIEPGIDGLLHVSDMSWTRKVSQPGEVVKKGDVVRCKVVDVDIDKHRIALSMKHMTPDPWEDEIPSRFSIGTEVDGVITKITNFGVFVELDEELEGLLHVSELASGKDRAEDVVKVGQKIRVQVIKLDSEDRKIGLTVIDFLDADAGDAGEEPVAEAPVEEAVAEQAPAVEAPAEEAEKAPAEEAPAEEAKAESSEEE